MWVGVVFGEIESQTSCIMLIEWLAAQPLQLRVPLFLSEVGCLGMHAESASPLVTQPPSDPEPRPLRQHPAISQPVSSAHYPSAPCPRWPYRGCYPACSRVILDAAQKRIAGQFSKLGFDTRRFFGLLGGFFARLPGNTTTIYPGTYFKPFKGCDDLSPRTPHEQQA